MRRIACFCLLACLLMTALFVPSCICSRPLDPDAIRGLPLETLREMREAILARHADGSALSSRETADVELLREQERRLENAWVFGEWRERHGTRLIFRDDGSVSVGARGGVYDEWGVYRFISPEEPAFESTWSVGYDEAGDPVISILLRDGDRFLYPCHRSRDSFSERRGTLTESSETGFYFTKIH